MSSVKVSCVNTKVGKMFEYHSSLDLITSSIVKYVGKKFKSPLRNENKYPGS
nr:MAG TPA: hypothetical protein [Caudoviricetes sp.]